mmetsp:Transcript_17768/g.53519  ORF Transcript_17768/g.53519 Transcript_17768/m.53519 type:complete len:82 (-) Transcript_17768:382-627(-)
MAVPPDDMHPSLQCNQLSASQPIAGAPSLRDVGSRLICTAEPASRRAQNSHGPQHCDKERSTEVLVRQQPSEVCRTVRLVS